MDNVVFEKKRENPPWAEVVGKDFIEKVKIWLEVEGMVKRP